MTKNEDLGTSWPQDFFLESRALHNYGGLFLFHLLFKSYVQEKLQVTGNMAAREPPTCALI